MPNRKVLIKLRQKPKKPTRFLKMQERLYLDSFMTVATMVAHLESIGVPLEEAHVAIDYDGADIIYEQDESDELFEHRMGKYRAQMVRYNEWFVENKEIIRREIEERKAHHFSEEKRLREAAEKRLQREISALEKKLVALK